MTILRLTPQDDTAKNSDAHDYPRHRVLPWVAAYEARSVVRVTAPHVSRRLRVRTKRTRAIHDTVRRVRCDHCLWCLPPLDPSLESRLQVELVRARPAPA